MRLGGKNSWLLKVKVVLVLNVYGRVGGDIWTMTKGDVNGSFPQTGRQDRLNGVRFELPGLAFFLGVALFFSIFTSGFA